MVKYFSYYGRPLTTVKSFNYIVRILTASYYNFPEVVGNLQKSWKKWARMLRVLVREGGICGCRGTLFKAVVQAVLLFGSNTWVMTPHMGQNLGGVYHRVSHRLMEKKLWAYT